ncbi:MAG: vitamin B12 transporter [Alphaproteobacteria bacterium]|jgi:vitamin B12 transporter
MKTQIAILAAAVLTSLCVSAQAQQKPSEKTEAITILGTHSPVNIGQIAGAITVIDETQIKASGAIGIADLLRTVAGVNVGQTGTSGSLTEVRFRGSESNHIMVLVDGVPINDGGQGGLTDFSHLLVANIARIEILRGPQSAIWGSNAIAGIISISTKKASSEALQVSTKAAVGDHNTFSASAHVAQQLEDLGFNINVSTYKTQGENISREGDEDDGYSNTDLSGGINYQFNDSNRIDLNARILDYTADADGYNFATGLVGDGNLVAKGNQISVGLNWYFTPTTNGKKDGIYSQLLSLQYSKQDTDNFSDNLFERMSQGEKLRVLWSNRFEFTANKWLNIGLESTSEDFKQQGPTAQSGVNQSQSNDTWSVVSDGVYAISNALSVSASYRYDNNDIFDNASSYRAGATYAINNDWRVFVSQGQAIKNPTFVERFGFFPNSFLGNPDLVPEQQRSTEAGIEGAFENISIQLNWFNAELNNEVLGFVFVPETGQFTAQNASAQSTREGIELSLSGQIQELSWQAQYSYLDASEGNSAELRRSRHTGSVSTTYSLDEQHQLYVQADYAGTKFDNFFPPMQAGQRVSLSAYWLLSTNYQYTHNDQLSANLRLSNMFNEDYEDVFGYNTDGSRILLSLAYSW